jgi:cell division protein FtsW (lipid II flippase)
MRRLVAFFDPSTDTAGISYQINQALIAVGSGGLAGRGFGTARRSSATCRSRTTTSSSP